MNPPNTFKPGYRLCAAVSLLFLLYGCLLAKKSIPGFPTVHNTHTRWPWLADKPVGEDGFYMLTVADNLATTGHLVYNYNLPATGIQPLSTVVFAGIAFLTNHCGGNSWTLIRAIILFGTTLFVVFAWQIAFIAADLAPPELKPLVFNIAFCLVLFDFSAFRLFTYGLETGIYLVCIGICMHLWLRLTSSRQNSWPYLLLFGLAAGTTGLARIDFGLIFAFLLGYLLIKRLAAPLQILVTGMIASLVVSPWFLFVHSITGSFIPSSGKAEGRLLVFPHELTRIPIALVSILANLCTWTYAGANTRPTNIISALSALLLLFLAWRVRRPLLTFLAFRDCGILGAWLPALSLITVIYVLFFWSTQFYERYFSPLLFVTVPYIAILLAAHHLVQKRPFVIYAGLALLFCFFDIPSMHGGHVVLDHSIRAGYIHQNFPTARVGMFQSGVNGYFNRNVENLDGKLNQAALRAAQAHHLEDFIDSEHINVLMDWTGYMSSISPDYLAAKWQSCPVPTPVPDSACYIRKSITAAPE